MAKLIALVSVFAILGLVVVDASIHRTTVTTEIEEIDETGRQQSQKCRQQIQSQDLSHCERFITQSGPMTFNPEQHRQQCCQQLQKMDEDCRCEALREMVKKQQQQGQMQREEMQEMMKRVRSIPTYCRMARCQWTEEELMMNGDENPQKQGCRQQIQRQDLSHCEYFITQRGPRTTFNMEHRPQCCQQLQKMDKDCRCEALMEIVRQQQQQAGQMQSEEMQEMMKRARSIPTYCRMSQCQWTEEEPMMNGDENPQQQGCRQQIRQQDMNKCERFIRQQSGGHGIVMTTSTHEVQGCCQQLSQVDKQCRCEALKEIVRKQQQQGRVGTEEMEEMMQIAQSIPKMCNMEPRTCQWRIVLY